MFSLRFHWDLTTNRLSEARQAKLDAGAPVLDLTQSNPTQVGLIYDVDSILRALSAGRILTYEPTPQGLPEARLAIAEYYRDKGCAAEPDALFLTASTSEAYAYLFKLLTDPGDEILVPQPSYPLFEFLVTLESLQTVSYPLVYETTSGWRIDMESLEAAISPRTAALVVVNPNNPTGSFLKTCELDALNALCDRYGLALVVDEVFADYGQGQDSRRVETAAGNQAALTFVLSGLSKVVGLPQLKLSWIHLSGPPTLVSDASRRLELISDSYLSVAAPIQHACAALLAQRGSIQQQIRGRIEANGRRLEARFTNLPGATVLAREGGWYGMLHLVDGLSDEERTYRLLVQENVWVHPGYFYDVDQEGFLILSLLTPEAAFEAGLARIQVAYGNDGLGQPEP